jgi:glycosyltransferase involved in cell wall biosynthesis
VRFPSLFRFDMNMELTILMPCLNEAETVSICVQKAKAFLLRTAIDGEVVVADNGSTDGSQKLAGDSGARVVDVPKRGYGAALIAGIEAAKGRFVIMADADDSYDFQRLEPFVDRLRGGDALVMGNRFLGGIAEGAMPALHRYLGNPVLSFIGKLLFRAKVNDFHCGLRGFNREAISGLNLQSQGMEFASEMVVKATLADLIISEVPTTLSPDGRSRPPHLRSWRDGWRHLRFLLVMSPRWLFLYPGLFLLLSGLFAGATLTVKPVVIGGVTFDIHTLVYAAMSFLIGIQLCMFSIFSRAYGKKIGVMPREHVGADVLSKFRLEYGLVAGLVLSALGIGWVILSAVTWASTGFGGLDPSVMIRTVVPAGATMFAGIQLIFGSFFLAVLDID